MWPLAGRHDKKAHVTTNSNMGLFGSPWHGVFVPGDCQSYT